LKKDNRPENLIKIEDQYRTHMANELPIKSLLSRFPISTKEDWISVAKSETGTADPLDQLSWQGPHTLSFLPFYDRNDLYSLNDKTRYDLLPAKETLSGARFWRNQPPVVLDHENTANEKALHHLQQGADGILFLKGSSPNLQILLQSINLSICDISFQLRDESNIGTLRDYCDAHYATKPVNIRLMWETIPLHPDALLNELALQNSLHALGLIIKIMDDPVEEIISALSDGVVLLDHLTEAGFSAHEVIPHIHFSLSAGPDFFFTIAKLKVLRMLWYQVIRAYGVHNAGYSDTFIHVRCEPSTNKNYEPHGTMISNTTSSIAAICGGCDALTVFPSEQGTASTSRVACNVSTILREETHMDKVADPIAGSYFVESLIHRLSKVTWERFAHSINTR
jgi:methylmalonyl-CoA mutase